MLEVLRAVNPEQGERVKDNEMVSELLPTIEEEGKVVIAVFVNHNYYFEFIRLFCKTILLILILPLAFKMSVFLFFFKKASANNSLSVVIEIIAHTNYSISTYLLLSANNYSSSRSLLLLTTPYRQLQ